MIIKFINEKVLGLFKKGKVDKKGIAKKATVITLATAMVFGMAGCSDDKVETPDTSQGQEQVQNGEEETELSVEEQLALLKQQMKELQEAMAAGQLPNPAESDTYFQADWDKFVASAQASVAGKINNRDEMGFITALTILNLEYLDENGKQILLDQYAHGQDIERILNDAYSLLSQIREWNIEMTSVDKYFSYDNLIIDANDRAILAILDGYVKEIHTLNQDLTAANKKRIQEIFDIVLAFAKGTGKIETIINGNKVEVSKVDLTKGGLFAAENTAQVISVMSRHAVNQTNREQLDNSLRAKDNLAKTQEVLVRYVTLGTYLGNTVDAEEQARIIASFNAGLAIITTELEALGVTSEEAMSLYTLARIDYFMNGVNSQYAFNEVFGEGIDINGLFTSAEEAVRKIQVYNDAQPTSATLYNLGRVFGNETDLASAMAITKYANDVTSDNEETRTNAVNIMKGYNQFSSDVFVHYTTTNDAGEEVQVKLDKNALSKGAHQIINWYSYYSVQNNKEDYGQYADAISSLVDGTEKGLDPYEAIVLMVTEYCAENNIVVFDYTVGNQR